MHCDYSWTLYLAMKSIVSQIFRKPLSPAQASRKFGKYLRVGFYIAFLQDLASDSSDHLLHIPQ